MDLGNALILGVVGLTVAVVAVAWTHVGPWLVELYRAATGDIAARDEDDTTDLTDAELDGMWDEYADAFEASYRFDEGADR